MEGLVEFREVEDSDMAYIHSSWMRGMKNTYQTQHLHHHQWIPVQRNIIRNCLKNSEVHIAYFKDDITSIVGYIVCDGPILHWINVKHTYRGYGIAKEMIKRYGYELRYYSHTPPLPFARKQRRTKELKDKVSLVYHPFYVWENYYGIKDQRIVLTSAHSREGGDGSVFGSEEIP